MMQSFTKVIATIGPALESPQLIRQAISSGVDIFRFNFKHNTIEWHSRMIEVVNKAATDLAVTVGTMIDLQGPEIRILMPKDQIEIVKGESIVFGQSAFKSSKKGFSITHPHIIKYLNVGQRLVADDGAFQFTVEKKGTNVVLHADNGGILKNRKTLNIPGANFPFPSLVDRDFEGLELAALKQIDYIALSFVRTAADINNLRAEMKKYRVTAAVIAKIETEKALKNLDEIINACDGVMVARGDLGVEMPIEEVPYHQKVIIKKSILASKPVITATQMLESMLNHPYPTRAEISDIANATYDLTDGVMLSAESASGKYPTEAIKMMKKTVQFNEKQNRVDSRKRFNFSLSDKQSLICDTAYGLYLNLRELGKSIGGFVVFTDHGATVRFLSRYRPLAPIFAFAGSQETADSLLIHFGVIPMTINSKMVSKLEFQKGFMLEAVKLLKEKRLIRSGELLIALHGDLVGVPGGTSTLRLITV